MGAGKANPPIQPPEPPASERLESWKEIANYLKRGVTTVQRWEQQEGLPVHRHPHEKRATPYAFKAELDAWWENGRGRLEALEQQEKTKAPSRRLWWTVAAAAVAMGAVAVGTGLWLVRPPALPFEERDWVLIASFENRTGEAVLDGTLEHALERELSNSPFVNVVPRERINDALGLMKKPPETKVDAALGREICLRDGGIRALLSGRVEKLDNTYMLSASLVEPSGGVTVAGFSEEAVGQKEFVPAVRRLSSRLREALGENLSLIQQSAQELEKVTTPSLRALQLFSQADALIPQGKSDVAEQLLKQAVAEDPEFASGYTHLAHTIRNQRRPEEEYRPHAERAVKLSEKVSDRERYFILGSYYSMLGQDEKAITTYEALLRLYPDHYWGTNNLASIYMRLGQHQERTRYLIRRADLRPNDLDSNYMAFQALVRYEGDLGKGRPYLLRARKLAALPGIEPVPWVRVTTASEYWQQGHMEKVFSEVVRFEQLARSGSRKGRDGWAGTVGWAYLALGKLKLAEQWFHSISDPGNRIGGLTGVAFVRGDRQALIDLADGLKKSPALRTSCLLRAGLLSEAEEAISDLENENRDDFFAGHVVGQGYIKKWRGELALARGNTGQAIALFEEAVRRLGDFLFFVAGGSESLAHAWEQQGNFQRAIGVLEAVRPFKTRYLFAGWATTWMKTQLRLAQLYRKVGREQEAREIEAELRKLLPYADPDHPFLRQLNRSQEVALAQPPN